MSSTKEVKIKKDKSSKKSKSAGKSKVVDESPVDVTEDVSLPAATEEVKAEKDRKEKRDKSSKTKRSAEQSEETAQEEAPIAEPKPKKSKRVREPEDVAVKDKSPAPESMEVDSDEKSDEPPAKKRKAVIEGEELEVDVTKPQPPSKKELRRLKKGKPLPKSKTVSAIKVAKPDSADKDGEGEGEAAADGEEKPKKPEQEKRSEHGIWVGNLPWSVSKEDLKSFLINNGSISDENITRIHMPSPDDGKPANKVESRFTRTQHNKGFAYVDFSNAADTDKAVGLSEELLGGRRVLIKNNKSFEGRPLKSKEDTKKEAKAPSKRIFLGNLRFDTTEESLKEHFERCGPIETCMVATFEDSGKCKGYAWITFEELESAQRAVRGFVLEKEEDSDEEDTEDEEDDPDSDPENYAEAVAKKEKPKKKVPMKRVYVNMIQRRPVRIEFAEDAQVRYKKRYGAGGTKNPAGDAEAPRPVKEQKVVSGVIVPSRKSEYRTEYAPRLTGGIVESKGKKVVF